MQKMRLLLKPPQPPLKQSSTTCVRWLILLPNQLVLGSASVNLTTGAVINAQQKTTDVDLDAAKISHLNQTKKIIVRATATTLNGGNTNIKIYDFYKLDVQIGAKAKMRLSL